MPKTLNTTLLHGSSPVNLLHIFRTPFLRNTSGWLLLKMYPANSLELEERPSVR